MFIHCILLVANQRLSRLYGANTRAEGVVIVSSYLSNDLICVVTLHATVMASGPLTYLMGCGVASNHCKLKTRLISSNTLS